MFKLPEGDRFVGTVGEPRCGDGLIELSGIARADAIDGLGMAAQEAHARLREKCWSEMM